jgi:hypothetical protein
MKMVTNDKQSAGSLSLVITRVVLLALGLDEVAESDRALR